MADDTRDISVTVSASNAIRNLTAIGKGLGNMNSLVGSSDKQLASAEKTLQTYGTRLGTAVGQVGELKDAYKTLESQLKTANKVIAEQGTAIVESTEKMKQASNTIRVLSGSTAALRENGQSLRTILNSNSKAFDSNSNAVNKFKTNLGTFQSETARTREQVAGLVAGKSGLAAMPTYLSKGANAFGQLQARLGAASTQSAQWNERSAAMLATNGKVTESVGDMAAQNIALRYALYSVAATFGLVAHAGEAAFGDLFNAGITYQKNIASVLRTSQVESPSTFSNSPLVAEGIITSTQQAADATQSLTQAFLDLQSTIPVTSEDLTTIATLGSQMGISAGQIVSFTRTVAEFSSATGISADVAATGIARLGQLVPTVQTAAGNYSHLASAILKTGVNSIATEQQILQTAQNIAGIATVAHLSQTNVVALSSATASLGITSELTRSALTQSFTKILTATNEGGAAAQKFGDVLGETGAQFTKEFSQNSYATFVKLVGAIANSSDPIGELQNLGLASQRLTPTLLKMGENTDVFTKAQSDSAKGMKQNTELTRQFDIIAKTTAARIQVLQQAWQAFLVTIGGGAVDILGGLAGALSGLINGLSSLSNTPVGRVVESVVITVGLLATGLAIMTTAATFGAAALLGLGYVIQQLDLVTIETSVETGVLSAFIDKEAASALFAAGKTALLSGAMGALKFSLRALTSPAALAAAAIIGITAAVQNSNGIDTWVNDLNKLPNSIKGLTKTLEGAGENGGSAVGLQANGGSSFKDIVSSGASDDMISFNRGLGLFGGQDYGDVENLDSQLSQFAAKNGPAANKQLLALSEAWKTAGGDQKGFAALFPQTISALDTTTGKTGATVKELKSYYATQAAGAAATEQQNDLLQEQADTIGAVTDQYVDAQKAHDNFTQAMESAAGSFINVNDLLTAAYKPADTTGTVRAAAGGGLNQLQTSLDKQLDVFRKWSSGIEQLSEEGAGALANAFVQAGPASQQAVTDALALSPKAREKLNESMREAAYYASQAYAEMFYSQDAILSDIYQKTLQVGGDPQKAVHDAIVAMGKDTALTPAEAAALEKKFGIKIDVSLSSLDPKDVTNALLNAQAAISAKPITIPVVTSLIPSPKGPGITTPKTQTGYQVTEKGHTIVLNVAPDTKEGQKELDAWRASNYKNAMVIPVKLSLGNDAAKIAALGRQIAGIGASITVSNKPKFAAGGMPGQLRGPGTGTSDSFLAAVSNGEYINTAASVRYYGPSFFDALNKRQFPKFAGGGSIGNTNASGMGATMNINVTQNYPTTVDPMKKLKQDAENLVAGIFS